MNHSEESLYVTYSQLSGGGTLYMQSWRPEAMPRAAVLLVHGFAEHSGRYAHVARHLVERGFAVHATDHYGHGKSDGTRGYVEHFSVYLDGVTALLEKIKAEQLPVFLLGHSMGGLISSTYLLANQAEFVGCVLSGPAVKTEIAPPGWLLAINRVLSRITPKLGMMKLDATGISRDKNIVAEYLADPLVYKGKLTARLVCQLFSAMDVLMERAAKISVPILFLHGEADLLAAPIGSTALYETVSSGDKELKLYPGLFHEIFNEPERDRVLADMSQWMLKRLPRLPDEVA